MSDTDDETRNLALGAVAGVLALVLAGVIALAASSALSRKPPDAAAAQAQKQTDPFAAVQTLYFDVDSDRLPRDADAVLGRVADAARSRDGVSVLISGFHDATGDAAHNVDLARRRALAVRHALEANGVSPRVLVMSRPEASTGSGDERQARRVEMRLQ